jgi:predicted alpha/beta superfamily hydrolase
LALASTWVTPAAAQDEQPYTLRQSLVTKVAIEGHDVQVMVAWPETPPPPSGFPVLYVLDGEDNFAAVTQTARRLAEVHSRSGVEPGIVVGLDSGPLATRVFDYTPKVHDYMIPKGKPANGLLLGGGDTFLDMLEVKIIPLIASRFKIDTQRQAILGHSFGGLLALHAALTRPNVFSTVIAVSPSFWYGNQLLSREADVFVKSKTNILITIGAESRPNGSAAIEAEAFSARLNRKGQSVSLQTLPGLGHGATLYAAIADAVTAAFTDSVSKK